MLVVQWVTKTLKNRENWLMHGCKSIRVHDFFLIVTTTWHYLPVRKRGLYRIPQLVRERISSSFFDPRETPWKAYLPLSLVAFPRLYASIPTVARDRLRFLTRGCRRVRPSHEAELKTVQHRIIRRIEDHPITVQVTRNAIYIHFSVSLTALMRISYTENSLYVHNSFLNFLTLTLTLSIFPHRKGGLHSRMR